jgi:hypothetical protein
VLTTLIADPQQATADDVTPPTTKPARLPLLEHALPLRHAGQLRRAPDAERRPPPARPQRPPRPHGRDGAAEPLRQQHLGAVRADALPLRDRSGGQRRPRDDVSRRALIKPSGGCNDDGDKKKTARWTTRPVLENTVVTGNFTADLFTKLAGTLTGKGILCFTFYDWTIDASGKISNKTKLLSAGWTENPYPSGTDPDEIKTGVMRFLTTGTTRTDRRRALPRRGDHDRRPLRRLGRPLLRPPRPVLVRPGREHPDLLMPTTETTSARPWR